MRAPRAAVLGRQGLDRAAAPGREGLPAGALPVPGLHIDTGHNFPEALEFRDRRVAELGERLIVATVQDSIDARPRVRRARPRATAATAADRDAAGRDRRARASTPRSAAPAATRRRRAPRSASSPSATSSGSGSPRNQRPELWNLYNARIRRGEHVRVFPISNWTELDVWHYIAARGVSRCPRSTSPTSARCSSATGCSTPVGPYVTLHGRRDAVRARPCASAPSAT